MKREEIIKRLKDVIEMLEFEESIEQSVEVSCSCGTAARCYLHYPKGTILQDYKLFHMDDKEAL